MVRQRMELDLSLLRNIINNNIKYNRTVSLIPRHPPLQRWQCPIHNGVNVYKFENRLFLKKVIFSFYTDCRKTLSTFKSTIYLTRLIWGSNNKGIVHVMKGNLKIRLKSGPLQKKLITRHKLFFNPWITYIFKPSIF